MQKTYNHYVNGKLVATYNQNEATKRKNLKQIIERRKYAERDARLLTALAK